MSNEEGKVHQAYAKLAEEEYKGWQYRYNHPYLVSKFLVEYALMAKVDLEDKRVLNIGCFEPIDEVYFAAKVKEWYAIDINQKIIEAARRLIDSELSFSLAQKIKVQREDVRSLSFPDESFDVVVSFSTIDHIPSPKGRSQAVSQMCRVLKKGGYLIITAPNRWNLFFRFYVHRRNIKKLGYEYAFSPPELKRLLCENNMKVIEATSSSFNPLSFFHLLSRKLRLDAPPKFMGMRFGYLAKKTK